MLAYATRYLCALALGIIVACGGSVGVETVTMRWMGVTVGKGLALGEVGFITGPALLRTPEVLERSDDRTCS